MGCCRKIKDKFQASGKEAGGYGTGKHGTHQELLANDGYYASAFHHQYGELPSREEQEEYRQVTANERK